MVHALLPGDEAAVTAWIKPFKEKLLAGGGIEVISDLDEALMCLETVWRNVRWLPLLPQVPPNFDPSKN